MKKSRRAARMERHHRRKRKSSPLNLVSLMDIFTILVFFLLVNSAEVQTNQSKSIKLPESLSQVDPKENIVIQIDDEAITVQGRRVISVPVVLASKVDVIKPLQQELKHHFNKAMLRGEKLSKAGFPVTIMGDRELPYQLLKKVMNTCSESKFGQISLAVVQKNRLKDSP